MTNKLDLDALEARAKLTASMVVGPSSMSLDPYTVMRLISKAREVATLTAERDAARAANEENCERLSGYWKVACAERDALKAERDEIRHLLVKEDKAHERTIGERDEAQECVSNIYFMMTGRSPEWSNNFGYEQCLEELRETRQLLGDATRKAKAALATRDEQIAALKAALEPFVKLSSEAMDEAESIREMNDDPPAQDDDNAGSIYAWALRLTWGDLRRARAALDALTANARSE